MCIAKKEKNNNIVTKVVHICIVVTIALVLTFPSMEIIKNVPGNGFSTDLNLIATTLLVFVLWLFAIIACIWLAKYLVNSRKLEKTPLNKNAKVALETTTKKIKISTKVFKWVLIIAGIYLTALFIGGVIFILVMGLTYKPR